MLNPFDHPAKWYQMTLDEEDDVERSVTAIKYSYSRVTFNVFREDENFNFSVSI